MRPEPQESPQGPTRGAPAERAWIVPGLLLAGALMLARTWVLAQQAQSERGVAPDIAHWTAARQLPAVAIHALVFALVAAVLAWRLPRRPGLAFALPALLFLSVLSGWPTGAAVDLGGTGGGMAGPMGLGAMALAACAGLTLALAILRQPGPASVAGSTAGIAAAALVGVVAPLAWIARTATSAPRMPVREVVTDLVQGFERFRVVSEDPDHRARRGVISPLVDFRFDTADKPALVMPPTCELELVVSPEEDGARLYAAAGVDLTVRRLVASHGGRLRVRFEALVDGERVFEHELAVCGEDELRREGREAESNWRHLGDAQGLELRAGQRIGLRTSLPDFEGRALPAATRGLALGFGGLTIERRPTRPRTQASPDRPNVVLIVMDTLRADRMSCYGYRKKTTPHVDRLAEQGLLFEQAFATSSWTWPATASLLTGLLPDEHGVTSNASCTLDLAYETLAEALQGRGFTTAAISCNPLISPERYFDQGFETFESAPLMRDTIVVIDEILATLERLADTRFFLYLHLADPHTPHRPLPSELARLGGKRPEDFPDVVHAGHLVDGLDVYAGRLLNGEAIDDEGRSRPERIVPAAHAQWIHDAYDASVGTGDHYCGQVIAALERLGLSDRTVIAFTSDHGEELFDHGLLAHGHTLHRELTHVPLVLSGPGIPRGVRVPWEVSNRHLAGALARIGGAHMRAPADAVDLFGPPPPLSSVFYQTEKGWWKGHRKDEHGQPLRLYGLRADGFVAHRAPVGGDWNEPLVSGGQHALYRTEDDPIEAVDISELPAHRERGLELVERIASMVAAQRNARQGAALGAGASGRTSLTALGYVPADEDEDDLEGDGR